MTTNPPAIEERHKLDVIWTRVSQMLAPPPPLLTSQCAEKYRYLPTEVSTKPGKWKNSNAPYLVEPMDIEQLEPWINTIIMMKASRTGGTEVWNNKLLRKMKYDPGPALYIQQSDVEARKYSDVILQAMIDNCEPLRECLVVDNTLFKKFIGGLLVIAGAQTPKAFRLLEFIWSMIDDLDGCPAYVGDEGDLVTLAETRTANAARDRLNMVVSSPTLKGYSPIEKLFLTTDQRRWHAPCPICEHEQIYKWGGKEFDFGVKWEGRDPSTTYYLCEQCHKKIYNFQKYEMNLRGRWIKTAQSEFKNVVGYHFTQVFSNFVNWSSMVESWLKSYKNPNKLQVFVNTRLGETFEDKIQNVSDDDMTSRCEEYGPEVPVGPWILTAFADVQHDRLEVKVCGWGKEFECWVLEYKVLYGDPAFDTVWNELWDYISQPREHESGIRLKIMALGVDSGYMTDEVYKFVRKHQSRPDMRVVATKGANEKSVTANNKPTIAERSSKNVWKKDKVQHYELGTYNGKTSVFRKLLVQEKGAQYVHFYQTPPPGCITLDEDYFQGLTNAKRLNMSKDPENPKVVWKKKDMTVPDEPLDCMVGNLAMVYLLLQSKGFDLTRMCERMDRKARALVEAREGGTGESVQQTKKALKRRGGGFVGELS